MNERLTSIAKKGSGDGAWTASREMLAAQPWKGIDRFTDMKADLDPQRLKQELALFAQKSTSPKNWIA